MNTDQPNLLPFLLETRFVPRVWGGHRMGDGSRPIGETWGAFEGNRINGGPLDGVTLTEACEQFGANLLGESVVERFGKRFPILTKLLDTNEWLSVQLHPNDEQAVRLEGAGQVGKTEAWHLLETEPGAEIILGLEPGVDATTFAEAIRGGRTLDVIARQPAREGDTWFIAAGTVHALGPGIFLYEVQQSSDITYRVYDWDRPASAGRELHIDQAIACIDPVQGVRQPARAASSGVPDQLVSCPYFRLDRLTLDPDTPASLDTGHRSFHALTAIGGAAPIHSPTGDLELGNYETAIVPASTGAYEMQAQCPVTLMIAYISDS